MNPARKRLFHAYARLRRPMTLGARAIVENEQGEICFVRHTYMRGWYLPGGGIERAETALTAIARELVEEAGVKLTGHVDIVGFYSNHGIFPNDHVALFRVTSDAWEPCQATSRGEIAEICWASPNEPPDGITPGNAARLAEVYQGQTVSPYWAPATI